MSRMIREAFLLSKEELLILLQIVGCKSWYGFYIEESRVSEEEAIKVIYKMVKKGFIYSDGIVFHVNKLLSEAIKLFKAAEVVFILEDMDKELPMYCCYIDEKVLICEWMTQRKNTVKFKICDKNDLYEIIAEEGYFQQHRSYCGSWHENPTGQLLSRINNMQVDNECFICCEENDNKKIIPFDADWISEYFTSKLSIEGKTLDWSGL